MSQHEVAVVFVHGIGSQLKSSTLSAWGEPLTAAFDRQLKRSNPNADVYVESSRLTMGKESDVTLVVPAHTDSDGNNWAETRIHLIEAWWAKAFLVQRA